MRQREIAQTIGKQLTAHKTARFKIVAVPT